MKKVISLLLTFALAFCLTACTDMDYAGDNLQPGTSDTSTTTTEKATTTTTTAKATTTTTNPTTTTTKPTTTTTTTTTAKPTTTTTTTTTAKPTTTTTTTKTTTTTTTTTTTAKPTTTTTTTTTTTAKPTTTTTTTTTTQQGIKIIQEPGTVGRNEQATVSIQGKPNTSYSIYVYYSSGPSKAAGLETKTADGSGNVSWTWKVGGKTTPGNYRIVIKSTEDEITLYFDVV